MATAASRYNNNNNNNNNNMISPISSRPTYNDSFDQPAEPFECDVSAILPVGNISHTSILSGTEDPHDYSIDNDSFAPSTNSFQHEQQSPSNHNRQSLQFQQTQYINNKQQRIQSHLNHTSGLSKHESEQQDALGSRYLQVENDWYPQQHGDHQEEYSDEDHQDEEDYMYQQGSSQHTQFQQSQQQQQFQRNPRGDNNNNNSYMSHHYDDEPAGGLARLSTIAELSELPSLNITNITNINRHPQFHRNEQQQLQLQPQHPLPPSGPVVVSRDLVLEDLYVEGQDEENERNDEIQRQLLANLKPTDILGPIHETRDFQISSLTGNGKQWERLQPHHHQQQSQTRDDQGEYDQGEYDQGEYDQGEYDHDDEQQQEDQREQVGDENESYFREDGESELSSTALALKREYEALFGSKGAVDSERSGSDVTGLVGYDDSADLYGQGDDYEDDEEDDFFGGEEDEDDQEEEFYAMLDLNGGNGNMILGNNIPRKPRVLAPPPGSRLPVPGSAIKQKVPLALQSSIVTRLPTSRTTPQPTLPVTPPPQQLPQPIPTITSSPRTQLPASGLRPPQTSTKKSIPTPSVVSETHSSPKHTMSTASILDGLWKEPEYDSQPEESPGAILAAKIAKDIKEEEERKKKLSVLGSKPSLLQRPSMLKPPSKLPARSSPLDNDMDLLTQMLKVESAPVTPSDAPTTSSSSLLRATPPTGRSIAIPPKVSSVPKSVTQHSRSTTPTAVGASRTLALSGTKLGSGVPPSATSSASSSPRAGSAITHTKIATPVRGSALVVPKVRSSSAYTGNSDHSPSISRTASPISLIKSSGLRGSVHEQNTRDTTGDEPLRQSSNKGQARTKTAYKEELHSSTKERFEDSQRRTSYDRKKELQRELEEIEAEEVEQQQQQYQARRDVKEKQPMTPRKLSVRTNSEQRESRRSDEIITYRRSDEKERERERDRFSSAPTSPLSPRSPRSGLSSKRSSIYGAHGDRIVPTLEESYKQLAKIRQDIVDLREEIHQDQPGYEPLSSSTGRLGSSKRSSSSRRNSLESKYTRETTNKSRLGRSESFDSGNEDRATSPSPTQNKRFGSILGKIGRAVLSGSSSNLDNGLGSIQQKSQSPKSSVSAATSHKKGQSSNSMSHTLKPSRTVTESDLRSSHLSSRAMSRQHSNPMSPTQKYSGYEDRHHSGSSGQSEEFSDEVAYQSQGAHGRQSYQQPQQQQSQNRRYDQQQYASNQHTHHFRQADDGSLILSEKPEVIGGDGDDGCPAQIRPKEVVFSSSVAGEVQSYVTLYNRSRRKMHFEILRPAGITVTPSYGMIQPGRDQRLTIHLAEMRGPGRVVVELDGEWLVPFGISFD